MNQTKPQSENLQSLRESSLTRRDLMERASIATVGGSILAATGFSTCTVAAAAQEAEPTAELELEDIPPLAEEAQGITYSNLPELSYQGEVVFDAQGYTPTKPTETQPNPPSYLNRIVAEYARLRPDVQIKVMQPLASGTDRTTYMQTKATSGQLSDIVWHNGTGPANNLVSLGIFQSLEEAIERPNPYIPSGQPGSDRWGDVFDVSVLEQMRSRGTTDGKLYYVSGDYVGTGIFYNKTAFQAAGIDAFPQTWAEFLDAHAKLKDSGLIPFGFEMSNTLYWWWLSKTFYTQLLGKEFDRLNVDNQTFRLSDLGNAVGWVTRTVHPDNPAYRDCYRIFKEWSAHWQEGYLAATDQDLYRYFVNGEMAMYWSGSWAVPQLLADPLIDFEWEMGVIPTLTTDTSEFATDILAPIEGCPCAAFSYLVPTKQANSSMSDEKFEAVIDWLMFLTAPQNGGPMINDLGSFLPTLQGATPLPSLTDLIAAPNRQPTIDGPEALTTEAQDTVFRLLQDLMGDQITLDEYFEKIVDPIDQAVEQRVAESGWDLDQYK